jgi:hypothetical protein
MSWHFSQALEAAFSAGNCSDGEPSAPWRSIPSAPDDSCSDRMKDTFHRSPFGTMFVPSTDSRGAALLTWFRAGFPARTSALQAEGAGSTESEADSGEKCGAWWLRYDPDTYSWRTRQRSLVEGWELFLETWPRSGLMRDGKCYLPPASGLGTSENESGSWLPTLGKNEFKGAGKKRYRGSSEFRGAKMSEGLRTCEQDPIYLTPLFGEYAMGWPLTWTGLAPLETAKFQQWLQQHGIS